MRIRPEQLQQHMQPMKACYCLHGEEPLLLQELAEAIRTQAKQQEFLTRDLFFVEGQFRWQQVMAANQELSLFANKKIIELRIPSGKTGQEGSKTLLELINTISPDNILLIIAGKLDTATQKAHWYKALDKQGVIIPVYPLNARELITWIQQRANKLQLNIDRQAAELLAARTEGNLLATTQALEKFIIEGNHHHITNEDIEDMVGADARYTRYQLLDAALQQDFSRALTILNQLRQEGVDILSILNSFVREIRLLSQINSHPSGLQAGIQSARIWPKNRIGIITNAATKHNKQSIQDMITLCLRVDRCAKGQEKFDYWILLTQLIDQLSHPK